MITFHEYLTESLNIGIMSEFAYRNALALGKRDPQIERTLLSEAQPYYLMKYASNVMKDRWPEAEDKIQKSKSEYREYLFFLKKYHNTEAEKWKWLKDEGITQNLFEILNFLGMSKEMQEHVIHKRPDLIDEINLDPELKKKYAHELSIARIDI